MQSQAAVIRKASVFAQLKENIVSYSFVLPFLAFCTVFSIYPIIKVFLLSFQDGSVLDSTMKWVWFENYRSVFSDSTYYSTFINNIWFILLIIPSEQFIGLSMGLMLRRKSWIHGIFETVYFFPMLISTTAASVIISYVLSNSGPANYILMCLGINEVNWLGDPFSAKISVAILELWKGSIFYTYIYLAALRGLPREYTEASEIDGAGRVRQLFHITLPLIKNTILLCLVMTTIWTFQIFDSIYMMTGGGPLKSTETIIFSVYRTTFQFDRVGIGAALAIVFLVIILVVSLMQMVFLKSDYEY